MNFLKNHPFEVAAHFNRSIVLTFAFPKAELERFIPEPLTLDTFQNEWAFFAIALVDTSALRPKAFPGLLGNDFFLIGYRIFVRYRNLKGRNLRGLYILKSETNKKKMEWVGNFFTHYNYSTVDISLIEQGSKLSFASETSGLKIEMDVSPKTKEIPFGSPFKDWADARKFAGPLPHTFTCDKEKKSVLIIEGVREHWTHEPLKVENYIVDYFDQIGLKNPILASAFRIDNTPYYWKKGRLEKW